MSETRDEVPQDPDDAAVEDVAPASAPEEGRSVDAAGIGRLDHGLATGRSSARWRWSLLVAVPVVVAVVLAALGPGGNGDGPGATDSEGVEAEAPVWETIEEPTDLEPLSLGTPLWGSDAGGPMDVVSAAVFRDDDLVLLGGDERNSGARIAVVDPASGTPRWSIGTLDELPGGDGAVWWPASDSPVGPAVVDQADSWAVLVPYYFSPCPSWCHYTQVDRTEEYGVAALSATDGHVLWKTTVVPAQPMTDPPPQTPTVRAMVAGDELALLVVEPGGVEYAPSTAEFVEALRVVAVDPASGSILWETSGVWPEAVVGDTVLAHVGGDPFRPALGADEGLDGPALVGLDAATGRTRWDLSARYRYSDLELTVQDLALVEVPADEADASIGDVPLQATELLVIDLGTGREVTSLGSDVRLCRTDGRSLVACAIEDPDDDRRDRVATFHPDDRHRGMSAEWFDGLVVDAVWDGRMVVTAFDPPQPEIPDWPDTAGSDAEEAEAAFEEYDEKWEEFESWTPVERRWSVDPSGRTVDATVPGDILAASDRYVILACGPIGTACEGEPAPDHTLHDSYTVYPLE